ncbi:MAG: methylenetetrahydrofolate--tRNA-(uracil(54)-C(5))-methyltransferase (FADH(2)-oxidizing) TrmFO [Dehalococcoidales bacterium]
MTAKLNVIGGGLAGCEAAWAAANLGVEVILHEMRPLTRTEAHETGLLAELVCSNSLKSLKLSTASGILKEELNRLGSLVISSAYKCTVAAGDALAVDRHLFAQEVTERLTNHPGITLVRDEVTELAGLEPVVVAAGPLASEGLCRALAARFLKDVLLKYRRLSFLSFYDAISPIVAAESLAESKTFRASRYKEGEGDYINCPMTPEEYGNLVTQLRTGQVQPLRPFEKPNYFQGCLPIEELARRGDDAMRFGPLKPVGLKDPRTSKRPYAVVQLRVENKAGTMYNMVGFQTRLKWGEQKRILRLIPGLEKAEFLRYGQVHRNTFINAPLLLKPTLQLKDNPEIFVAGQLVGVEGYVESAACGLLAGINAARLISGQPLLVPPQQTCLGALVSYITQAKIEDFQPMNVNLGLLPPLEVRVKGRLQRKLKLADRALAAMDGWRESCLGWPSQ